MTFSRLTRRRWPGALAALSGGRLTSLRLTMDITLLPELTVRRIAETAGTTFSTAITNVGSAISGKQTNVGSEEKKITRSHWQHLWKASNRITSFTSRPSTSMTQNLPGLVLILRWYVLSVLLSCACILLREMCMIFYPWGPVGICFIESIDRSSPPDVVFTWTDSSSVSDTHMGLRLIVHVIWFSSCHNARNFSLQSEALFETRMRWFASRDTMTASILQKRWEDRGTRFYYFDIFISFSWVWWWIFIQKSRRPPKQFEA